VCSSDLFLQMLSSIGVKYLHKRRRQYKLRARL
jgi:hypothetical protein